MALDYSVLADIVLVLHFGIVLFVVLGLPAIVLGNWMGATWANHWGWRLAHVLTIGVVVLQAWLGRYCGLTVLETELRLKAGQAGYEQSFIAHWLQEWLYVQAPLWLLSVVYTVFGLAVAWAWWKYPPRRRHTRA